MSIWTVLGVAFLAYLCGMIGSLLGAKRLTDDNRSPGGWEVLILVLLLEVSTFWPVQLVKIALALSLSYALYGTGYALVGSCVACFIVGFGVMRFLPEIAKGWRKLVARFKKK